MNETKSPSPKLPPLREWHQQFEQIAAEQACGLKTSIISKQMHDMFYDWNLSDTNLCCDICSGYIPGILGYGSICDLFDDEISFEWCRCHIPGDSHCFLICRKSMQIECSISHCRLFPYECLKLMSWSFIRIEHVCFLDFFDLLH